MPGRVIKNRFIPSFFVFWQLVYLCTLLSKKHSNLPKTINRFGLIATLIIVVASGVMCLLHDQLLNAGILPDIFHKSPFWTIYFFLVPLSLMTIWFVLWRFSKD